eukprot:scaffold14797_cov113-Cylindrotheca_fusiformis.AAC.1
MAAVSQLYQITQDSGKYEGVLVHRPDAEPLHFKPSKAGLYYYDATPVGLNYTNSSVNAYSFVTTVAQSLAVFTPRQRRKIADAKRMYELIGRPLHARFLLKMINEAQVDNCPVTTDDANNFLKVYGPDVAALKGKTVRCTAKRVASNQRIPVPRSILAAHRDMTL